MADVVDLITADHREVDRLFELLRTEPAQRPLLLPVVSALLIAHSRAEEAEVYPVARAEAEQKDDVAHSQEEHAQAEELLERIQRIDLHSSEFDTVLGELVDAVRHHVADEEKTVLPGMREHWSEERRSQLAEAFATSRARYIGAAPGDETKAELIAQAQNAGMSGATSMSKEELQKKLAQG